MIRFLLLIWFLNSTLISSTPLKPFIESTKPDRKPLGHIIFDLGGVIIHPSMVAVCKELGGYISSATNFAGYMVSGGTPSELKKRMYVILDKIQPEGNTSQTKDKDGNMLPGLMCQWLNGTKTCAQLRALVVPALKENTQWFKNAFERRLICKLILMMFTPEKFVKTQYIQPGSQRLIKHLVKKGYHVHILSNWDPESFKILHYNNPDFFNLFDSIIISGETGFLKPEKGAFESFQHLSEPIYFIDDQKENILAAHNYGIQGIHFTSSNLRKIPSAIKEITAST